MLQQGESLSEDKAGHGIQGTHSLTCFSPTSILSNISPGLAQLHEFLHKVKKKVVVGGK